MKAVVLAIALSGCWHFSGADEPPPVESRGLSDARRDARGRSDGGVADADQGDGVADETGVQPTGGSLGAPGGPGRPGVVKGTGRPGAGWRRAPVDAGVVAVPPGCLVGRVITLIIQGSQVVLTVAAGSSRGVAALWTATLPNQPEGSVRILRVDKMVTVVAVKGVTFDEIRGVGIVALCP
jgi:hypothetical protein